MYLASDSDGAGPWLYSMDVDRRIPHRLTSGLDRYTSLAASADGRRLIVTVARPKRTLWRLRIADSPNEVSAPARLSLTTSTGFSPRLGPDYLLYASATGANESIWKLANGAGTELWNGAGAQVFGGPAISSDGRYVAFSVRQHGKALLYVMQIRRRECARCRRFARPARRSGLGPGWPIAHLGCERSRRPSPLPCTARRSPARAFCPGVLRRSCLGARRPIRCLLGPRHRHNIFGKGRRSRCLSSRPAAADAHSRRTTHSLPARRALARPPAR